MQLETILAIAVGAGFACYLVYRWQEAIVDMADPPYQQPVKTVECNRDCRQGRDCDCFQRSCDLSTAEFDKSVPTNWPFPTQEKP